MTALLNRLRQLSTAPGRQGGAFDEWIRQDDTPSFLAENAQEGEIVIYMSLRHAFLQTVIVPSKTLASPNFDDLQEWELVHDRWGINYSYDEPRVWLDPPFKYEKSNTLRSGEKLIFTRFFEGFDGDQNYFEILQKFAHVFNLHYVSHKKAWCKLDENGDVESIVRVFNLPDQGLGTGAAITMPKRMLDEYLLMSESLAVRTFDFTRFDERFNGWSDNRQETKHEDAELAYRLTIDPSVGSYLRGVQIVRPVETMAQFHYRLTHAQEAREYASFIAYDWKNGVVREISCAPGATANYFTKSSLPFETTPAFFRPEVLSKYNSNPEKYTVEERSISCRGSWSLRTYDINEEGQVHTYLVYLRNLPYSEQLYWKSFNEVPKGSISKRAFKTDFEGEFDFTYNPLQHLLSLVRELGESGVCWWKQRAPNLHSKVHYPATEDGEEWASAILALDQLLIEGLEESWLKAKAIEIKQSPQAQERSLALVERCLRGFGFTDESAKATIAPLRALHNLRSKMKGHATGSEAQGLRQAALNKYGSYRSHFRSLCADCDVAMKRIAEALS